MIIDSQQGIDKVRYPDRNSIFYLDVLRICAVYLVLLLHALSHCLTATNLYDSLTWKVALVLSPLVRMGVPLFFMISGYLILSDARTLDIATFYKRRFSRILIPFVIWNVIYYLVDHALASTAVSISEFLMAIFNQHIKYHFWYIYTLLGMYFFAPFFKRIIDSCTKRQVVLLLILILFPITLLPFFCFFTRLNISGFPIMVDGYLGFFVFGYLLGKWPPERKWRPIIYGLGIVAGIGSLYGNYLSSSAEQISLPFNTNYNLVHYMTAGAFFVLIQAQSDKLEKYLSTKLIKNWASITFGIYLSHVLIMTLWNRFFPIEHPALKAAGYFGSMVILSTLIMLIISRIKPLKKLLM